MSAPRTEPPNAKADAAAKRRAAIDWDRQIASLKRYLRASYPDDATPSGPRLEFTPVRIENEIRSNPRRSDRQIASAYGVRTFQVEAIRRKVLAGATT